MLDCVRWRPSSPRKVAQQPPLFGPCLLWPNDWMVQDAIWYGGRPWPRRHCVRWGPAPPTERGTAPTSSQFRPTLLLHDPPSHQLLSYCTRNFSLDLSVRSSKSRCGMPAPAPIRLWIKRTSRHFSDTFLLRRSYKRKRKIM